MVSQWLVYFSMRSSCQTSPDQMGLRVIFAKHLLYISGCWHSSVYTWVWWFADKFTFYITSKQTGVFILSLEEISNNVEDIVSARLPEKILMWVDIISQQYAVLQVNIKHGLNKKIQIVMPHIKARWYIYSSVNWVNKSSGDSLVPSMRQILNQW